MSVLGIATREMRERFALYRAGHSYQSRRDKEIRAAIASLNGRPCYLVLGDSNVETAALQSVAGVSPINAGMSGGTVGTFLFAGTGRRYVRLCRPMATVVAVGANDVRRGVASDLGHLYKRLLSELAGPCSIVVGMSAEAPNAATFNAELADVAHEMGATLLYIQNQRTTDGLHWTREASAAWAAALAKAVGDLLDGSSPVHNDRNG
jgi:lysophospholipase L1-like esterase